MKRRRIEKAEGQDEEVVDGDDQEGVGALSSALDELRTSDDGAGRGAEAQLLSVLEKKTTLAISDLPVQNVVCCRIYSSSSISPFADS